MTVDNKRITVPNGSLMNSNVVDYTSEPLRRVDLEFSCAKSEKPAEIQQCIPDAVARSRYALRDPASFAHISGGTNEAMTFSLRGKAFAAMSPWDCRANPLKSRTAAALFCRTSITADVGREFNSELCVISLDLGLC